MEQATGQLLGQNSLEIDNDHKIWNLNDDYSDFGSNWHIFDDNGIENRTPVNHGKDFIKMLRPKFEKNYFLISKVCIRN